MALKAVFLDAGRTLVTERTSRAGLYAAAARARGLEVTGARMADLMAAARRDLPRVVDGAFRFSEAWFGAFIHRIFVERLGLDPRREIEVRDELLARFSDPREFRLYPGSRELLDALARSGLHVGVLSNWSERLVDLLDGLGLAGAFDSVVVSSVARAEKPEPAIFEAALREAGVAPTEALHAGDEPELDVAGAEAVGMRAVLVDHEGRYPDFPGERVTDLHALRARILGEEP